MRKFLFSLIPTTSLLLTACNSGSGGVSVPPPLIQGTMCLLNSSSQGEIEPYQNNLASAGFVFNSDPTIPFMGGSTSGLYNQLFIGSGSYNGNGGSYSGNLLIYEVANAAVNPSQTATLALSQSNSTPLPTGQCLVGTYTETSPDGSVTTSPVFMNSCDPFTPLVGQIFNFSGNYTITTQSSTITGSLEILCNPIQATVT